jgi:1,4-dihydroxy-2-naphthoate polyprenyltransferase
MRLTLERLKLIIRLVRPHFILGAALLYALGAGVARYLGSTIDWGLYLSGQAWITAIQLGTHLLNEYYDAQADRENPNRTLFSGGSDSLGPGKLQRETAFWAAILCFFIAASLSVLLLRAIGFDGGFTLLMVLIFLGAFFYSVPPVRLVSTGYGEFTTSFLVANLVPAVAFWLQYGELHRLLAMATFPLTPLHLAMMLAFELPDYATDGKFGKNTLLIRLGWERGMILHNVLILVAFLILGLATILGLPLSIALPVFLSMPLGVFQIWMMTRIADGAKPNWHVLTFSAAAMLGLMVYLFAFSFWTR